MLNAAFLKYISTSPDLPAIMQGSGHTHDPALAFILGAFKRRCADRDDVKRVALSALPPGYDGDLHKEIDRIIDWAEQNAKESAAQDDSQKARMMEKMAGDVFFHDGQQRCYIHTLVRGGPRTIPINSKEFERLLQNRYYKAEGTPIGANPLREVIHALEARALFDGDELSVHVRHAFHEGCIYIDLADNTGEAVRIAPDGVTIVTSPPVYFIRPTAISPLPRPKTPGDVWMLKEVLDLTDKIFCLVLIFIVGSLSPDGPYSILLIEGEQGSGETILSRLIKKLLDPFSIELTRAPSDEKDLLIQAQNNYLLGFDNLSGMPAAISDAFCRLATGGGIVTRKLFTDDEVYIFKSCRPMIMNGISDIATRPDLLERSILLKLQPIDSDNRKTEAQIYEGFDKALPEILGGLYTVLSAALRELPNVRLDEMPRMADFARFVTAAEEALGFKKGDVLRMLDENQADTTDTVVENYALAEFIIDLAYDKPFIGTVGDLLNRIGSSDVSNHHYPRSPAALSKLLKRLRPALRKQGVLIDFKHKTRKGRMIEIEVTQAYRDRIKRA